MVKGRIIIRQVQSSEIDLLTSLINNLKLRGEHARKLLRSPASLKKEFESNCFSTESSELFAIADHSNNIVGMIGHFITAHYSSARELGFTALRT